MIRDLNGYTDGSNDKKTGLAPKLTDSASEQDNEPKQKPEWIDVSVSFYVSNMLPVQVFDVILTALMDRNVEHESDFQKFKIKITTRQQDNSVSKTKVRLHLRNTEVIVECRKLQGSTATNFQLYKIIASHFQYARSLQTSEVLSFPQLPKTSSSGRTRQCLSLLPEPWKLSRGNIMAPFPEET
jgi:hypothetical protein